MSQFIMCTISTLMLLNDTYNMSPLCSEDVSDSPIPTGSSTSVSALHLPSSVIYIKELPVQEPKNTKQCYLLNCVSPHVCAQLCPMDWIPPGSSVYGIFQTRILEWVAISYSRGSYRREDTGWNPSFASSALPQVPPRKPMSHKEKIFFKS